MILKFLAHTFIGAGLTIWLDLFRGCTFSADQIIGLTILIAIAGLIIGEIYRTILDNLPRRPVQPQIDIRTLFEEVKP